MKKREYRYTKINYSQESKKAMIHFSVFFFIISLFFSIIIILVSNILTTHLGGKILNENDILTEYVMSSLPTNADDIFINNIDTSMEELFDSPVLTNFYFSTEDYPVSKELTSYLESSLTDYVENNPFVSFTAVYASTTNTYLTSNNINKNTGNTKMLEDMIFNYNSNTLERTQVPGRKSNTFFFQYKDKMVVSKDLTTLAGTPHAIMFVILDMDNLASSIYESVTSVPYKVSIYDNFSNCLYSNSSTSKKTLDEFISKLPVTPTHTEQSGTMNYLYSQSSIIKFQYILEINKDAVSSTPKNPVLFYSCIIIAITFLSIFMVVILFVVLGKPISKLLIAFPSTDMANAILPSTTFNILAKHVESTLEENQALKKIVATTSKEAITSLFTQLIAGQKIDSDEIEITLENTGYDFHSDDIYIAGMLYAPGHNFINVDNRYRTLSLLNANFEDFKVKEDVNLFTFSYDDKSIIIVASFAYGTSIAKGKSKINTLKGEINEALNYSHEQLLLAFGNMYNSIFDLSFSYNEAFRGIHYMSEAKSTSNYSTISLNYTQKDSTQNENEELMESEILPVSEESENLQADLLEAIYRRSEQIAKLVWDEKNDHLESLIDRTLNSIFEIGTLEEQTNNCKILISAVTNHMISYPFVSDTHLSDVYNQLSEQLKDVTYSAQDLRCSIKEALLVLCNDFTKVLKKQRNPYIVAAIEYIKENYGNCDLSLESIAEDLKIAPNYLSTIFSKNLGVRLFEYISDYRLNKSIEQLLTTDKSINDISIDNGFGSARNYIRIFKKHKNIPPGAYRKQHKEQQSISNSKEDSTDESIR